MDGRAPPCPDEHVALAARMADAARAVTLRHFRSGLEVMDKADESPVTIADREAETLLRGLAAEAFPDHGLIGEEHGSDRPDAEFVWVFDPIDGTKRFITGNPLFGTLIALLRGGAPILGVIDMPALGERWIGAAGRQTSVTDRAGTREARVRACAALSEAVLTSTSPDMFKGADAQAFERVDRAAKLTLYGGDCFNYGSLASGYTDLVIEASLGTYDYVALVPVVEGAGGLITDWTGAPLGLKSDGRVVAAGDRRVHEAALGLLQGD